MCAVTLNAADVINTSNDDIRTRDHVHPSITDIVYEPLVTTND